MTNHEHAGAAKDESPLEPTNQERDGLEDEELNLPLNTENPQVDTGTEKVTEAAPLSLSSAGSPINIESQAFFDRMSEKGRQLAEKAYEGIYKIPGVNRVVGKLEIAYNQFWMDKHEAKAVSLKEKMGGLDLQVDLLGKSKTEIESVIKDLIKDGMSGGESLQLKLKEIDQKKDGLLAKRDKIQTKFESRDNKVKSYANERDRVADKLIGRYDEKLEPMERELESLDTCKDRLDLLSTVAESREKEQLERLGGIEKRLKQTEDALGMMGMDPRQIRKFDAIKILEQEISSGKEKIRAEKERLASERTRIEARIVRLDKKANPYRDKREQFARVKKDRPIKIKMKTRNRGAVSNGREEVTDHTRAEVESDEEEMAAPAQESRTVEKEVTQEQTVRHPVSELIESWNFVLHQDFGDEARDEIVDLADFQKSTKLKGEFKLEPKDFRKILDKYYRFRKMPSKKFSKTIVKFTKEASKPNK